MPVTHPMDQFHQMLANIQNRGAYKGNRTGVGTHFLPNQMLTFDMAEGFPAITTKKLPFKSARGEILGMWRGYDNAADFDAIGCPVWYQNANETPAWLASPYRRGPGDIGRAYSKQFTDYKDWRSANTQAEADRLAAAGYTLLAHDASRNTWIFQRGINQLEECLRTLMTKPEDRRMIVSAWRPDEHDQIALPACHYSYNLVTDVENKELHLLVVMRSWDTFLAFNITIGAIWLSVYAKMAGYTPRLMSIVAADAHVYTNHTEQVNLLLSRDHYPQPQLQLGDSIPVLKSVDEIPGVFARIQPDDISLVGYQSHPAIKAPMAA